MWILLYLGPAFLVATLIFAFVLNNAEGAEISFIAWLVFTFVGVVVKPRTIPEWFMTMGNAAIFTLAIMAALLGWI